MSKATLRSLSFLSLMVFVAACSKEQPPTETAAVPEAASGNSQSAMPPHPTPAASPTTEVDLSGISKAEGGKTVAEVFAEKDALGDAPVIVRGKVVKVNAGIMGKNWLHVRDGSGAEGSNDLTVTTTGDLPKVGDTVVVTGPVTLNKDFGMGYSYDVIVEDAAVTVEAAAEE